MNVQTITMDPNVARVKLAAYQEQLRRRVDEEYGQAVQGYQALAQGTPLLNLVDVFRQTGLNAEGWPHLAIARADRKQVQVRASINFFEFSTLRRPRPGYNGTLVIDVACPSSIRSWQRRYALVPMVPADVRPKGNLRDFFVLWEVEQWAEKPLIAEPDKDPYLLQHIGGDLYAVVAEWDLTELERAIMTGRKE